MPIDYTRPIRVKCSHEKVEILKTDLQGERPILAVMTLDNGMQYAGTFPRDMHDWENVPASKRSGTVWVNVYEENFLVPHHSRKEADKWAERAGEPDRRLACVEVH